jgi:hypothetical protein
MTVTAALTYVLLWYGKNILRQLKNALNQITNDEEDIHNRLMRAYPDIPEWMYLVFFAIMVAVQIAVSLWTPFTMPVWSVFLCIGINLVFLVPYGVIAAITGMFFQLNVVTEFVIGLIIPG